MGNMGDRRNFSVFVQVRGLRDVAFGVALCCGIAVKGNICCLWGNVLTCNVAAVALVALLWGTCGGVALPNVPKILTSVTFSGSQRGANISALNVIVTEQLRQFAGLESFTVKIRPWRIIEVGEFFENFGGRHNALIVGPDCAHVGK